MRKWMTSLIEEIGENKSKANEPMSALSGCIWELLEKLQKNKRIGKLPMSALSGVNKRASLRFNNIQNIYNNLQTAADKADIGSFVRVKYQLIDFLIYFEGSIEMTRTRNRHSLIRGSSWIAISLGMMSRNQNECSTLMEIK